MYIESNGIQGDRSGPRVAVIGSGIAGLSAAWLLSKGNAVTLYEAENRPGGHANTVDVTLGKRRVAVDTGFIVYNEANYPNLVALFDHLRVKTEVSDMSFGASIDNGALEYSSTAPVGLFGQPSNIVSTRFWTMISGILRFYREAPGLMARSDLETMTLGQYLDANGYRPAFINDHLLPMAAAIWSASASQMRDYPLIAFIRFFRNHGLLQVALRPKWRTVTGGSRAYVARIIEQIGPGLRLGCGAAQVTRRPDGVLVTDRNGHVDHFDDVVIATHADQALALLGDADKDEHALLSAFAYTDNDAVLHTDRSLMPKRRAVWSSWNYVADGAPGDAALCVTYWMNRLQNLDRRHPLFVTLNPNREIRPDAVLQRFSYRHPLFNPAALAAQRELWRIQGNRHTWFAGSYFGHGFHEDALQSGLAAAEDLSGVRRPWAVRGQSSRISVRPQLEAAE